MYTTYKAGSTHVDRQLAVDQCRIASLKEIPQSMATQVSGGYYNPGTVSCSTVGNYTSCNNVGAVNIPATATSYDQNQSLRDRFINRCLQDKGYQLIPNIPVCGSEAERKAALYSPQPASAAAFKCSAGVRLDS